MKTRHGLAAGPCGRLVPADRPPTRCGLVVEVLEPRDGRVAAVEEERVRVRHFFFLFVFLRFFASLCRCFTSYAVNYPLIALLVNAVCIAVDSVCR